MSGSDNTEINRRGTAWSFAYEELTVARVTISAAFGMETDLRMAGNTDFKCKWIKFMW